MGKIVEQKLHQYLQSRWRCLVPLATRKVKAIGGTPVNLPERLSVKSTVVPSVGDDVEPLELVYYWLLVGSLTGKTSLETVNNTSTRAK